MAGNKIHEIPLDGAVWKLQTLRATEGLAALTQVIGIAGGSLRGVVGGGEESGAALLGGLAQRIAEPATVPLVKQLLSTLHKNDAPVTFDEEFAENYGVLIDLVEWALKINFAEALKKSRRVGALVDRLKKEIPSTLAH